VAQAKSGDIVRVHYTGRLNDGMVFDSSAEREPLELTIGENRFITAFEQAVIGMEPGEAKTIEIPTAEAFGPHREEMVNTIEKSKFPPDLEPKVGQLLNATRPDGQTTVVTVINVTESGITLDANHILAGKDLAFEIELVEIL